MRGAVDAEEEESELESTAIAKALETGRRAVPQILTRWQKMH